jgi:hypothetical protein
MLELITVYGLKIIEICMTAIFLLRGERSEET